VVVGFPSNQFGAPGPGQQRCEIASFCELNYGVSFPMMGKVDVNGTRPTRCGSGSRAEAPGVLGSETVKWNFTKFLVGRDGKVIKRYAPNDEPERCESTSKRAGQPLSAASPQCRLRKRTSTPPRAPPLANVPMFEHLEPYAGDPILSLNEAFQKDPRPRQGQPVDRHLLRRRRPHPGAGLRARAEAADAGRSGPKPYLPIEGCGQLRARGAGAALRRRPRGR
jgi:hypothetical protein